MRPKAKAKSLASSSGSVNLQVGTPPPLAAPTPVRLLRPNRAPSDAILQHLATPCCDAIYPPSTSGSGGEVAPLTLRRCRGARACIGCQRVFGVDGSYFTASVTVEWPYVDGRGDWCRDCHHVWRLIWSSVPLALMKNYIAANGRAWSMHRLAILLFRAEGAAHINSAAVAARVALLEFLERLREIFH